MPGNYADHSPVFVRCYSPICWICFNQSFTVYPDSPPRPWRLVVSDRTGQGGAWDEAVVRG